MSKENLQEQARNLGLDDSGTVAELEDRISASGAEPDPDYTGPGQVTPFPEDPLGPDDLGPIPDREYDEDGNPVPDDLDEEGSVIVLPEYERQVADAAARADDVALASIHAQYHQARRERAQANRQVAEEASS